MEKKRIGNGTNHAPERHARKLGQRGKHLMLTFVIGLVIGTLVGVTAMCLLVMGKGKDRLDVSPTS